MSRVQVSCSSTPSDVVTFPCGQWFDKKNGLEKFLTPDRDGDGR